MLGTVDWVIYGIGLVLLLVWIVLFFMGMKHSSFFDALDEKEYPFKEVFFVGYAVVNIIKYRFKSKSDIKLRKELGILYGEKYADYYLRVIMSQKITMGLTVACLIAPVYGIANDKIVAIVMAAFALVAYYYFGTTTSKKIETRSEEMLNDFSNVVSKLALLTNAGMIMREAWEEVAYTGDSTLYIEMQKAVDQMNNGMSEIDALYGFGTRCIIPEIKKFTSTIIQGMVKGNSELISMLQQQSSEVWMLKKQNVRRQGEKAASKLLIPIMIMFVGILVMIIVPIFGTMGM